MKTEKRLKRIILYCIPLVLELFIHFVASGGLTKHEPDSVILRVFLAALLTKISMLMGEGYGSIAFIVAGVCDRIGAYIAVIILSVFSAGANLVGYMITGIEGKECLWMTVLFWCIDLFLIVFSIIRITQLLLEKNKLKKEVS